MKTLTCCSLMAFIFVLGCSKAENDSDVQTGNSLLKKRTASPIAPWGSPAIWDDNVGVLKTALWYPPALGPLPNYSFTQFPAYDFTPYYINGETEYNPDNYDVMAHFGYISPGPVTNAVVEFTFPHIEYFLPHMNNINQLRIYTVNNVDNQTVITCITDLVQGMNPMFCFLVKIDCDQGNSGVTNFWTDMKVNGISVKGTIENKLYDCN